MSRSRTAKPISGPELPHDIIVGEFAAESSPLGILDEAGADDAVFLTRIDRQDGQFLPDRREMTDGVRSAIATSISASDTRGAMATAEGAAPSYVACRRYQTA